MKVPSSNLRDQVQSVTGLAKQSSAQPQQTLPSTIDVIQQQQQNTSMLDWNQLLQECRTEAERYGNDLKQLRLEVDRISVSSNSNSQVTGGGGGNPGAADTATVVSSISVPSAGVSEKTQPAPTLISNHPSNASTTVLSNDEKYRIASIVDQLEEPSETSRKPHGSQLHSNMDRKPLHRLKEEPTIKGSDKASLYQAISTPSLLLSLTDKQSNSASALEQLEAENQRLRFEHIKALEELATAQEQISGLHRQTIMEVPKQKHQQEVSELKMRVSRLHLEFQSLHEQNDILRRDNRRLIEESIAIKHVMETQREIHSSNKITDVSKDQLMGAVKQLENRLMEEKAKYLGSDKSLVASHSAILQLQDGFSRVLPRLASLKATIQSQERSRVPLLFGDISGTMEELLETHLDLIGAYLQSEAQLQNVKAGMTGARKHAEEAVTGVLQSKSRESEELSRQLNERRVQLESLQRQVQATELQLAGKDSEISGIHEQYQGQLQDLRYTMETLRAALREQEKSLFDKEKAFERSMQKQKSHNLFSAATSRQRHKSAGAMQSPLPEHPIETVIPDFALERHRYEVHIAELQDMIHALRQTLVTLEEQKSSWKSENECLRSMLRNAGRSTPSPVPEPAAVSVNENAALLKDLRMESQRVHALQQALQEAQAEMAHTKRTHIQTQDQVDELESEVQRLQARLQRESILPTPRPVHHSAGMSMAGHPTASGAVQTGNANALRQVEQHTVDHSQTIQNRVAAMDAPMQQVLDRVLQILERTPSSSKDKSHWDEFIQRWQEIMQKDGVHWASLQKSVEQLMQKTADLKQENRGLQREADTWKQEASARELDIQDVHNGVEHSYQEWKDQQGLLLSILQNYEEQFGRVLTISTAPTVKNEDSNGKNLMAPLQLDALPKGLYHPFPFFHHMAHTQATATSTQHALEYARGSLELEKKKSQENSVQMEALEMELRHAIECRESAEKEREKFAKQSKVFQAVLEEMKRSVTDSSEQNTILESKLTRIGEGFQRIMF